MTLYTKLAILNLDNDIRCEPYYRQKETGKWSGAINLYRDDFLHTMLLSTNPVFESAEASVAYMEAVVNQVRAQA